MSVILKEVLYGMTFINFYKKTYLNILFKYFRIIKYIINERFGIYRYEK